eukprot:TRINITY_DN5166_c0_g2_i1.p1 TRINITY_DN5166_c0_g2~~TRINITY_DN5166_c0_g2_i1.p1  ORF type:complete len:360 (+),score=25.66 TRINITY_DN5166_c0_g2_i1:272-1351(+)
MLMINSLPQDAEMVILESIMPTKLLRRKRIRNSFIRCFAIPLISPQRRSGINHINIRLRMHSQTYFSNLRWRPNTSNSKTKSILVCADSEGSLTYWHVTSGKMIHRIIEEDNQILAMDYSADGSYIATGGKDYKIRIYDENTKSVIHTYDPGSWQMPGHTNRIFCLKFLPQDAPYMLMSAGWDGSLHIWDTRQEKHVGSIFGVAASGDSVDYKKGIVLTGSYRNKDQVQLWDFASRQLISTINWTESNSLNELAYVYCVQFSKYADELVASGCSGLNEMRVFDRLYFNKSVGVVQEMKKGCYTLDWANNSNRLVFGGGDSNLQLVEMISNKVPAPAAQENILFSFRQQSHACSLNIYCQ